MNVLPVVLLVIQIGGAALGIRWARQSKRNAQKLKDLTLELRAAYEKIEAYAFENADEMIERLRHELYDLHKRRN